jgi:PAS domain S-box-containing protein
METNKKKNKLQQEIIGLRKKISKLEKQKEKSASVKRKGKTDKFDIFQNNELYRLFFNSINDALFVFEGPTSKGMPGKILEVNQVACRKLGYSKNELLKKRPEDIIAPDSASKVPAIINELIKKKYTIWEAAYITKKGKIIPIEASNHYFKINGKPAILSTVKDITNRKKTEETNRLIAKALHESEQRFRTLSEAAFEGISLTENGIIVDLNDQQAKIHGYNRNELIGKSVIDLVAPESRQRLVEAIRNREKGPVEYVDLCKDGRKIIVEVRSSSIQIGSRELVISAVRDITKHRQSEEALEHERNLLRVLIDNLPDLFYFKDAQCRYILNNPAHLSSIGAKSQEEVLGKTTFGSISSELAEKYLADEMKIIKTGEAMIGKEELLYRKDIGQMHWHLTSKIPVKDHKGIINGFVCISHDITEQKRVQEAFLRERNILRTLIDNLPDIIYFKDTEGHYVLNNMAHLQSIGAQRQEEVLGKTTFDFNPTELSKRYQEDEMEIVRSGKGFTQKEEIALHRDTGEERWHLTSKIPIINTNGIVIGIVGISRDITERKHVEETLEHERNLLRTLIDSIPEFINYKDLDGRYLLNNRAHLRSIGVKRQEDALGRTMFDFHPAELAKQYYENEIKVIRTGQAVLEIEEMVVHHDTGERRWHLTSKVPITDGQGKVSSYLSISTDITERKHAEDALERERNLLRTIIDHLPDMIFFKDVKGRYILDNLPHLQSIGAEHQDDIIGKTSYDFNPPELAKLYSEDEMKVVQTGKPMIEREELALHRDTGEERWHLTTRVPLLNNKGKVSGIVGIARDITERKRAEAERERLIKELQEALADIKTLSGLVPICANCKKIRDDKGYWTQVEAYIQARSRARFSHGICPECMNKLYPEFLQRKKE